MIIGRELLEELGIKILSDTHTMDWDKAFTPMLNSNQFNQEETLEELKKDLLYMYDPDTIEVG